MENRKTDTSYYDAAREWEIEQRKENAKKAAKNLNRRDKSYDYRPEDLHTLTMSQVYEGIYRSSPSIVEGLLCGGFYLLAGAPKIGKSFLVMEIAYHISAGKPLWGHAVRSGTVLYLSLEDDYGRLQQRMYHMFGVESTENLHLAVWSKKIGHGLEDQLKGFLRQYPDTRLIIIDTLQKACEASSNQYSYAADYELISTLKEIAGKSNICILAVHHTRKQQAEDRFDMISGTNGLLGAADGALLLQKEKRTGHHATLDITGRDQPDQRLYLVRNEETLSWNLEREETELWKEPPDPLLLLVAEKITESCPSWTGSPTELVSFLGVDMKPNTMTMRLNIHASRLLDEYNILYESSRSHDGRQVTLSYRPDA